MSRADDYAAGLWVPGIGAKSSRPVARITRKKTTGRGDEVLRCTHSHRYRSTAMVCAVKWAARENEAAR